MSMPRPDVNAKQMFFVGLLGLPWLWIVNVMYHWDAVFGNENGSGNGADGGNDNAENQGILAMMNSSNDDDENGKLIVLLRTKIHTASLEAYLLASSLSVVLRSLVCAHRGDHRIIKRTSIQYSVVKRSLSMNTFYLNPLQLVSL
jgi:hypothetical protein